MSGDAGLEVPLIEERRDRDFWFFAVLGEVAGGCFEHLLDGDEGVALESVVHEEEGFAPFFLHCLFNQLGCCPARAWVWFLVCFVGREQFDRVLVFPPGLEKKPGCRKIWVGFSIGKLKLVFY